MAFLVAFDVAIYSASVDVLKTIVCLFEDQETGQYASMAT